MNDTPGRNIIVGVTLTPVVDQPCDSCGGVLNPRYPLRLVAEGGPTVDLTRQRWICLNCIGSTLTGFQETGASCPACADLAEIFGQVVVAIKGYTSDGTISSIVVPPNKRPHSLGCEHAA